MRKIFDFAMRLDGNQFLVFTLLSSLVFIETAIILVAIIR